MKNELLVRQKVFLKKNMPKIGQPQQQVPLVSSKLGRKEMPLNVYTRQNPR